MELHRSNEHLDQRRSDCTACVDFMEGAGLPPQEVFYRVDIYAADHVNNPRNGASLVMLTKLLGSVSPRFVRLSIGTELDTLTTSLSQSGPSHFALKRVNA